jgi:energy-coupling factor transporter ATP-binding protein EcfA2
LDILPASIEEQIQSSITISANWAPNHLTASQTKKVEKICNEHLASAQSRHSAIGNAAKRIYCQYPGLGRSADSFVVDFFVKVGKDQKEIQRFLESSWEYAQKICSTYADSPSINHIVKQLASRPELENVIYARESFWKFNGLYWEKQSLGAIHKLVAEFNSILCRIGIGIREEIINAPLCKAIVSFLQQELLDESILEQNNTVFANTAIDTTFVTKNISKSLGHTHAFAFDYEPTSERSAEWEKFLSCSFATEDERENIEKFIARCILGSFGQSGGMILLGKPGTGKSTLINALSGIIGLERSETFSFDDFQDSRNLESLEICRLAIVPDSDRFSEVRNTSILKDAVFGDAISICPKYKNRYFIKPKCGFIFAMNTLPKATDDEAWFSRFNILQMNNVVRGTEVQIENYEELLIKERAQIVNRCLWVYAQNSKYASTNATCLQDWLASGLSHPARWLIEQTAQSFGDTINFDQAYVAFREWCKDEGILERFINNKKSFEIVMKEKEVFKRGKNRRDSVLKDRKFDTTLEQMASHLKLVK